MKNMWVMGLLSAVSCVAYSMEEEEPLSRVYCLPATFGGMRPTRPISLKEAEMWEEIKRGYEAEGLKSVFAALNTAAKENHRLEEYVDYLTSEDTLPIDIVFMPRVLPLLHNRYKKRPIMNGFGAD